MVKITPIIPTAHVKPYKQRAFLLVHHDIYTVIDTQTQERICTNDFKETCRLLDILV